MHVTDGGGKYVHSRCFDEFLRLFGRSETLGKIRDSIVDLGSGADVSNLSFDQDGGIDLFENCNCFFGPSDIFFKRKRRQIENDGIKTGLGCGDGCLQGMGMVCVQKNRQTGFLSETLDQSCELPIPKEFSLALGIRRPLRFFCEQGP